MEPADPAGRVDPGWAVTVDADARLERVAEALCSLADGRFGTRGAREEDGAGSVPLTLAAGIYQDAGGGPTLLPGPVWTGLDVAPPDGQDRRELDLRSGVLRRTWRTRDGAILRSLRFASLARPGVVGLRAEGPADILRAGPALLAPGDGIDFQEGRRGDICWARTRSAGGGGITAAACQRTADNDRSRVVDRLAVYLAEPDNTPPPDAAVEQLGGGGGSASTACSPSTVPRGPPVGGRRHRHRRRRRGAARGPVRVVPPHGSVADDGEAAVGARGLTGPGYRGHVFWDADTFILPFLAATHPAAARAMLEYRVAPAAGGARAARRRGGRAGARFPWESAAVGPRRHADVGARPHGRLVPIRTGQLEEHIVAEVAWAAQLLRRLDRRRGVRARARPGPARRDRPLLGVAGPLERRHGPTSTA